MTTSDSSPRDWPEDFAHENGGYLNTCIHCRNSFIGHKRRVTCKLCSDSPIESTKAENLPPRGEAETPTPTDYAVAILDRAIQLAVDAHAYQRDRQGLPQILHCLRVMFLTDDYVERSVAILHDTLEDTSLTAEKLRDEGMPERVVGAVVALTRTKDETYAEYIDRLALSPLATRVKILDLTDNINRLGQLPPSEQTSLGERYAKAWKILTRETANADY